jgi:hypothetical protein
MGKPRYGRCLEIFGKRSNEIGWVDYALVAIRIFEVSDTTKGNICPCCVTHITDLLRAK